MGLDSVELLLDFEKFFEIQIPDAEAGEIGTVQEAVDCISNHVKFCNRGIDIDLKTAIIKRLTNSLIDLHLAKLPISLDQKIFDIISITDQKCCKEISDKIHLELPLPTPYKPGLFRKFFDFSSPTKVDITETSIERFVDLICAVNYKSLLKKGRIQSKYEVLIGVMGITIDDCGVNPYEIFPDKLFVKDFGID